MAGGRRLEAPGNIRAGTFVRGSRGNILSDEEQIQPIEFVVVFIKRADGKILGVTRGQNVFNINMPGGGVDPGEDPDDAAKRELWEETGYIASEVREIYREGKVVAFKVLDLTGSLRSSSEGKAAWVDEEAILNSQYSDFYRRMRKFSGV